jgi:hypothetical protein
LQTNRGNALEHHLKKSILISGFSHRTFIPVPGVECCPHACKIKHQDNGKTFHNTPPSLTMEHPDKII